MKVLIAEDDPNTREGLRQIIDAEGYEVHVAADGGEALQIFAEVGADVVCLDVMMPVVSGYDVCREIRKTSPAVGILFISAKSEEIDKVLGLELGADDFIVKPFGVKEVVARIRAVTRRLIVERRARVALDTSSGDSSTDAFQMAELRVVPDELRAYRDDRTIDLSLRDVKVLQLLHRNRGKAVSRDTFFDKCWGFNFLPNSRCLDQHISQLRRRIEDDPKAPKLIRTVHGVGYRFE